MIFKHIIVLTYIVDLPVSYTHLFLQITLKHFTRWQEKLCDIVWKCVSMCENTWYSSTFSSCHQKYVWGFTNMLLNSDKTRLQDKTRQDMEVRQGWSLLSPTFSPYNLTELLDNGCNIWINLIFQKIWEG